MIGLGAMGGALARAFLKAGHSITIWNRTPTKITPFLDLGANPAQNVAGALQASPVTVICIDNYDVSIQLIAEENVQEQLDGRVLIQLSTGTPKEATEFGARITACGGKYIDGAIMAFPEDIGAEEAQFLFAGPKDTYDDCRPLLSCLGGDLRYLGSAIAAPAAIDLAFLTQELSTYLGAIHGAHLCESEKIEVGTFVSILPDGHPAKDLVRVIHSDKYDDPEATISVWNGVSKRIRTQAHDTGINSEIPEFISRMLKRAVSAGYGEEDIAALIKVLRKDSP